MAEIEGGFVLDCSVTMAWCFDDEATSSTSGVRDRLVLVPAVVPSLWCIEVAKTTLVGERRGRLDEARSARFLSLLRGLPIVVDPETTRVWTDTIRLARAQRLSAYDATYLELAIRLGPPGLPRRQAQGGGRGGRGAAL